MVSHQPPEAILNYYNRGREQNQLFQGGGQLELARTQELILRYLPKPPAVIMDIGGGAGVYALWLAKLGYEVHLVDMIPLHVEQAAAASAVQPDFPLASVRQGDARHLDFTDTSADAVLMLGPLYHLTERVDRVAALAEARRVLKPGGYVFAAMISRFASFLDTLKYKYLTDPIFVDILEQDLSDGQHRNPQEIPGYFSTAYFHHPDEVEAESADAGLQLEALLAVEGAGAFILNFEEYWDDEILRQRLLHFLRVTETDPSMLGCSGHLLAVSRKS